ncbi:MAG TPA: hypothetical protein VMU39_19890 [Solirubrobacteraceae bacterium]|nr:hypothetical protein [Solirubrobacteraceae bacterium]
MRDEQLGSVLERVRGTVRSNLRERLEDVGGREHPRAHVESRARQLTVVAGAVEPFVVRPGDRSQLGDRTAPSDHLLGVVGV